MTAPTDTTTWAAVPLGPILAGDYVEQAPWILARSDGRCLLYPERVHALHAEPEALKTWLALKACAECLRNFQQVIYIDFEDSAPSIVQRLLALGADAEQLADGFTYIRPDEPLLEAATYDLDCALEARPALVVIDGVTEAFSAQGLSPLDNSDIATWLDLLPRRIVRTTGAAVLSLDHVVKSREDRGRFAFGGQHKLAGVDVAYSLRVIEPFAPGRDGVVSIKVEKDRPGRIREFADGGQVATMRATSTPDGGVRISLEPSERREGGFRPTVQMERISIAVETDPGLSKRGIRTTVSGKNDAKDLALELLISEGYVELRPDGQASRHHSLKPYREADDIPTVPPCPDRAPTVPQAQSEQPCPRAPTLIRGTARHDANGTPHDADRAPASRFEKELLPALPGGVVPGDDPDPGADAELERFRAKLGESELT